MAVADCDMFAELSTRRLRSFLDSQLGNWPMAAANFAALSRLETRYMEVLGMPVRLQHNPARIASTAAKVDKRSIEARKCFLCAANRPSEQVAIVSGGYEVLVNPFPIFSVHFTIAAKQHVPQLISADKASRFVDMLLMARRLPSLALFYNGPRCGASAPDHFHFQAVEAANLPLLAMLERGEKIPYKVEYGRFHGVETALQWFNTVVMELGGLIENVGEPEPRMNILCAVDVDGMLDVAVIPRRAHRPDFYGVGENRLLLSPASVDLSGVIVVPSPDDFYHKITIPDIISLFNQTCFLI